MSILAERLRAVHDGFDAAGLAHAFGGAIALGYCTEEPRGTRDLDVNVFVGVDRADEVLDALPAGVAVSGRDRTALREAGQVRVMWDETPVDLFLNTHAFHHDVARATRVVPFEDSTIPVLGCVALVVFKAMFDRTKDWADIEAILAVDPAPGTDALARVRELLGADHPSVARLSGLVR